MNQTFLPKLKLYLGLYLMICAVAAFCLLGLYEKPESPTLNDNSWKDELHTNRTLMRDSDPLSLTYAGLKWTSNIFNCSVISKIENVEFVGAGWTKSVFKGQWKNKTIAIKTLNFHGHDVTECRQKGFSLMSCCETVSAKILREIALLTTLQHRNIIRVLGTCISSYKKTGSKGALYVTEYGEDLDTIKLLQMRFQERLKLAMDVADILYYLTHSPFGSLKLLEFRKAQFVLVDGVLKLSDVDDLNVQKPDKNCQKHSNSFEAQEKYFKRNFSGNVGNCDGSHERHNIQKAGQIFISNILNHGCPLYLANDINELISAYSLCWNTSKILNFTIRLYQKYISKELI